MNKKYKFLPVLCASILWGGVAFAQNTATPIRLAFAVDLDFEPTAALCSLKVKTGARLVRALFVPQDRSMPDQNNEQGQRPWIFCCQIPVDTKIEGDVAILVENNGVITQVRGRSAESVFDSEASLDSEEEAQQYLIKQRELLASFQLQAKTQAQALSRLRSDADLIGQQSSLRQREAELSQNRATLKALSDELISLSEAVKIIRSQAAPANGANREVELTSQLAEMAQAARLVEAGERERLIVSEGELSAKMAVIEETRYDDPEQIRGELIKLRRRRQELEDALRESAPGPLDYE